MKILHIDDSSEIREMYSTMLRANKNDIQTADNAKDGLKLVTKYDFDLILLDMCMPEYSGLNFIKDLKILRPSELKKVVLVSVLRFSESQKEELIKLGIHLVEEKPYSIQKLKEIQRKVALTH